MQEDINIFYNVHGDIHVYSYHTKKLQNYIISCCHVPILRVPEESMQLIWILAWTRNIQ